MGIIMVIDFSIFLILLGLLIYLVFKNAISISQRVYMALHITFMQWALLQFASQTSSQLQYKFLFIQTSYVVLALIGLGLYFFVIHLTKKTTHLKTPLFKWMLLPSIISVICIIMNPNDSFLRVSNGMNPNKQIEIGPLFNVLILELMFYGIVSIYLIINELKHKRSINSKSTNRMLWVGMIGIGIMFMFGVADGLFNLLAKDRFSFYIPFLSIGMLLTASYTVIEISRNNVLNIVNIAKRDVMESLAVGIIILDMDNAIIDMNHHVQSILPLKIGEDFNFEYIKKFISSKDWKKLIKLHSKRKRDLFAKYETEIIFKYNGERHILIQSTPVLQNSSKVKGFVYTLQDVTVIRKLLEETRKQNILLQERNNELLKTQEELFIANKKLEKMTITDPLTNCYNRRFLMEYLENKIPQHFYNQIPFSMVILDIDYFKLINDAYGHLNGDQVLIHTANHISSLLGPQDFLARYGGEEFVIFIPYLNREEVQKMVERIKNAVEENQIWLEEISDTISVTISLGVVTIEQFDEFKIVESKVLLTEIMTLADTALYEAKYSGRNKIVNRSLA